jgi:photosystem II protein PsbQ
MLKAIRRLAAFCLCISLCWGLMIPASAEAASSRPDDLTVLKRQAEAFKNTKARLPELARLVSDEDWTFTRNLIHGPMQDLGREMLFINQNLDRSERKTADKLARSLKDALASLDEAARLQDAGQMQKAYSNLAASFDAYSDVIPEEALS